MLIVEGPDAVGKTTLCKKFLDRLPGHVYSHMSRPPKIFDRYWGHVELMGRKVVQDRFHLGEIVYPTVRGETPKITPMEIRLLDAKIRLLGGMTVLVTATRDLLETRLSNQEQMYSAADSLKAADIFRSNKYFGAGLGRGLSIWNGYEVDIDVKIDLSESNPFVSDESVDRIVETYLHRQREVLNIAHRAPVFL